MRAVVQRVGSCKVEVEGKASQQIEKGLLVLLGVSGDDTMEDVQWLAKKIIGLRIFSDSAGQMNLALQDINGEMLVVSQFTLFAHTKKGNRPSFIKSAPATLAQELYTAFIHTAESLMQHSVKTGYFGEHMQVTLVNDGPVTIVIDTKQKE